jgi:hypothetical protein
VDKNAWNLRAAVCFFLIFAGVLSLLAEY